MIHPGAHGTASGAAPKERPTSKGTAYVGALSRHYDALSATIGLNRAFYRKVARALPSTDGMRVLDVGCGTGSLLVAMAERARIEAVGLDLSRDQVDRAAAKCAAARIPFEPVVASMDGLPFADGSFDAVVTSLALHEAPADVRRRAIVEAARVLREGGFFALADWGPPALDWRSVLLVPFLGFEMDLRGRWLARYERWAEEAGLALESASRLTAFVHLRVFRKLANA